MRDKCTFERAYLQKTARGARNSPRAFNIQITIVAVGLVVLVLSFTIGTLWLALGQPGL